MTGTPARALHTLLERREEQTRDAQRRVQHALTDLTSARDTLELSRAQLERCREAPPNSPQSYEDIRSLQQADLALRRHRAQVTLLEESFNRDDRDVLTKEQALNAAQNELSTTRGLTRAVQAKLQDLAQHELRKSQHRAQELEDEATLLRRLAGRERSLDSA